MLPAGVWIALLAADALVLVIALLLLRRDEAPPPLVPDLPLDPIAETCRLIETNHISPVLQFPLHRLSAPDVGRICNALTKSSRVTSLSLRWASMRTITPLAELLSTSTSLRSLDLSDTGLRAAAFEVLVAHLAANSTLTVLNLNGNPIADDGAATLAKLLRLPHCQLTSLDVGRTCLTERGARHVAEALECNTSLRHLSLEWNRIHSARALAAALMRNSTLQALHLGGGNVRGDGKAPLLGQVLAANTALRTLGLEWTALTDRGVAHLAEGLRANRSLTTLDLRGNEVREEGVALLGDAIRGNFTIAAIHIPVFCAQLTPALQTLARFAVLCAADRGARGGSRLAALPSDLLVSVALCFSFRDTLCTPRQLRALCRDALDRPSDLRAILRRGAALRLADGPRGLAFVAAPA